MLSSLTRARRAGLPLLLSAAADNALAFCDTAFVLTPGVALVLSVETNNASMSRMSSSDRARRSSVDSGACTSALAVRADAPDVLVGLPAEPVCSCRRNALEARLICAARLPWLAAALPLACSPSRVPLGTRTCLVLSLPSRRFALLVELAPGPGVGFLAEAVGSAGSTTVGWRGSAAPPVVRAVPAVPVLRAEAKKAAPVGSSTPTMLLMSSP
mmetsp:Transcript_62574/g.110433  ORF Transcript_62574/g.110433 Transcript_62574/m.110433 type:complete len:214 (-) Transcript_62574:1423-2064(-)